MRCSWDTGGGGAVWDNLGRLLGHFETCLEDVSLGRGTVWDNLGTLVGALQDASGAVMWGRGTVWDNAGTCVGALLGPPQGRGSVGLCRGIYGQA